MTYTVFYSWQSDIRAGANRTLIEDALKKAIRELAVSGGETIINPVIDRDTAGIPGSPDISSTILKKIDNCSVVVADVTLVDNGSQRRRFPNPNVLIEVGYAIKSLGFSQILLVQNTFNGTVEDLPFDLRGKRVMQYCSDPEAKTRTEQRNQLSNRLRDALVAILPILGDVDSNEDGEKLVGIETIRQDVEALYKAAPDDIENKLKEIEAKVDSAIHAQPETRSEILNRIVELWRRNSKVSEKFLYALAQKSIEIHPTSGAYFNTGLLAGVLGKPFDSISGFMKAVELKNPNPSLCFLNSGNRYREMNDINIAIAFYEKAVDINPKQANAWLAAAQLYEQSSNSNEAKRCYRGFLDWFNKLPENSKNESTKQQAQQAESYINSN